MLTMIKFDHYLNIDSKFLNGKINCGLKFTLIIYIRKNLMN